MAEELQTYILETRTPLEAILWRVLAGGYPFWALLGPVLVAANWGNIPVLRWYLIAAYSISILSTLWLLPKKASLSVRSSARSRSGENPKLVRAKLVKKVSLGAIEGGKQDLIFQFSGYEPPPDLCIDLNLVDNAKAANILHLVDKSGGACECSAEARSFLASKKNCGANKLVVAITYLPNVLLRQAVSVASDAHTAIKQVWSIMCIVGTCSMITLFIFFGALSAHDQAHIHPLVLWLLGILNIPAFIVLAIISLCSGGAFLAAAFITQNNIVQVGILALLGLMLYRIGQAAFRPNAIKIDATSLKTVMRIGNWQYVCSSLEWCNLSCIRVLRPAEVTDPSKWKIQFVSANNESLTLILGGFVNAADKLMLLKAIESHAPDVVRDGDIQTCLQPASNQTYTDLWLEALAQPPKREKLLPLKPQQTLKDDQYTIYSLFGSGGQGVTYLAALTSELKGDITEENCNLIVKESMLPLYVSEESRRKAVEHFYNDAQLLQDMKCEFIARLCDYFIEDHRRYLVLERIAGEDLRSVVEVDGAMSYAEVLKLVPKILGPLQYIHSRIPPVVHRDFTPDNLIRKSNGTIVLIDFDVASDRSSKSLATIVGKQSYIPPEQLRGQFELGSDVYALGATLYFLATGTDPGPLSKSSLPPLKSSDIESLDNSLKTYDSKNDRERLNQIIEGCTTLDVAKRISLQDIEALLNG